MFKFLLLKEIRDSLKQPSFYIYSVALFFLSSISFAGTAGFFDPHVATKTPVYINSPYEVANIFLLLLKFFLILIPVIIGGAIYKDYQTQSYKLTYAFPINKVDYLWAKFIGAFLVMMIVILFAFWGMFAAELLPDLDPSKVTDFNLNGYVFTMFIIILPTMLSFSMLVFSMSVLFRDQFSGYGIILGIFLIQIILENALFNSSELLAVLDPFGQFTLMHSVQNWTLTDRNEMNLILTPEFILNRLIWIIMGFSAILYSIQKFSFSEFKPILINTTFKRFKKTTIEASKGHNNPFKAADLVFSKSQQWRALLVMSKNEFRYIARHGFFFILIALAILAVVFAISKVTDRSDFIIYPVTGMMLNIPAFFYSSISILLTFIFSGLLHFRNQNTGMGGLVDVNFISDTVMFGSRVFTLAKMHCLLMFILMITGILIQLSSGFTDLNLPLYFTSLFGLSFNHLFIWGIASILIYSLIPHFYFGLFILISGWLGLSLLPDLGINHVLLQFNAFQPFLYSDLNGYGHSINQIMYTRLYWSLSLAPIMLLIWLIWRRGVINSLSEWSKRMKRKTTRPVVSAIGCLIIGFTFASLDYLDKVNISHQTSRIFSEESLHEFKGRFKTYETISQPKIVSVDVKLDMFPSENKFTAVVDYILLNKTTNPIDTIVLRYGFDEESNLVNNNIGRIVDQSDTYKYDVLKLTNPILPGDSLRIKFSIQSSANDVFQQNSNVLNNGTFLRSDIFPRLGYHLSDTIALPQNRKYDQNIYTADIDLINFNAIVSTEENQSIISAGEKMSEWVSNGRRFAHFKPQSKIKFVLGFHSGEFVSTIRQSANTSLEVHSHQGHTFNVESMLNGLESALEYNQMYFGDYKHKSARIVEFPLTEGSYATSYANINPISEMRFISRIADDKVNLPFYVAAHELTHQWWGNKVMPAYTLGATMVSESITEYITLNILRKSIGESAANQFLVNQHKRYFRGRRVQNTKEAPLIHVRPEDQYISYGKGSIVFQHLAKTVGEEKLNNALNEFMISFSSSSNHYPTSIDLISSLISNLGEEYALLIDELFKQVIVYDVKLNSATQNNDGDQYQLKMDIRYEKMDELKNPIKLRSNESIFIEFIYANGTSEIKRIHIKDLENTYVFNEKIAEIIIDPYLILLDQNRDDNLYKF